MTSPIFRSYKLWKASAVSALAVIGVTASVLGIAGISLTDLWSNWQTRLNVVFVSYIALVFFILVVRYAFSKRGITMNVNSTSVTIKEGDLFLAKGLKVIPFNEYFDTTVDDVVISHTSLNGIFIDRYIGDIAQLRKAIEKDDEEKINLKRYAKNGKDAFPLGRIIIFQDYLLLSFTLFNEQNMAHLSKIQYEKCLMSMWCEISRVYAGRRVYLPLLGSGITRFDDVPNKSNLDLLKCMLCTLKASGKSFSVPITILLTKEVMNDINLYDMKGSI